MSFDLTLLTNLPIDILALSQVLPAGVKDRCGQSIDRLTGRLTRHWRQKEKQEDADIDDAIKREGNKAAAQQKVLEQLVPDVAKHISGDPALLERATIEMMGEAYRKQENKDAVADELIKDIGNKHHDNSECEDLLDEDWLNIFSSYAEKASTERTRQLWGRILSREVRHPGRFSLSTLRILSEIDTETANKFTKIAPIVYDNIIIIPQKDRNDMLTDILSWHDIGIISSLDTNFSLRAEKIDNLSYKIILENLALRIKINAEYPLHISIIPLTKAGSELLSTIDHQKNEKNYILKLCESLEENNLISSYEIYRIINKVHNGVHTEYRPMKSWLRPE